MQWREQMRSSALWKSLRRYFFNKESAIWTLNFWKTWFGKPQNDVTLLLLTKQHLEIQKIKLSPSTLRFVKISLFVGILFSVISSIFFIDYLIKLPQNALIRDENRALRQELDRLQFHMDTLQTSIDRISRFDQKLRAMTEVDKHFAREKGPRGQGGEEDALDTDLTFQLGDSQIDASELQPAQDSEQMLDRREAFLVQKLYSWARQIFKDASLREQSMEELFEVLKGREIQLAATPSILPVNGWVTSHFGSRIDPFTERRVFHRGLDIAARKGAPIVSPAEGVVTFAGQNGGFGKALMLFHGYGVSTLYGHLDSVQVKEGQRVARGDVIANVGSSGRSTGAHLHYEVIVHGVHVDPRKYVLDRAL